MTTAPARADVAGTFLQFTAPHRGRWFPLEIVALTPR